jgi:hypothetical protein
VGRDAGRRRTTLSAKRTGKVMRNVLMLKISYPRGRILIMDLSMKSARQGRLIMASASV